MAKMNIYRNVVIKTRVQIPKTKRTLTEAHLIVFVYMNLLCIYISLHFFYTLLAYRQLYPCHKKYINFNVIHISSASTFKYFQTFYCSEKWATMICSVCHFCRIFIFSERSQFQLLETSHVTPG